MTDRNKWKPLTPPYKAAIRAYDRESRVRLLDRDVRDAITAPLYHYTDARGLEGIITAQQIWFTHYQHLNDPSEMEFGMTIAKKVLAEVGGRTGGVTGGLVKNLLRYGGRPIFHRSVALNP